MKAAIEKVLITKAIKSDGVERYWGPAKTLSKSDTGEVFLSTIYYERVDYRYQSDINSHLYRVLENITLTVKLAAKDSGTSVEFSFDEGESMFASGEAQQIVTETRARLDEALMNLELGHLH